MLDMDRAKLLLCKNPQEALGGGFAHMHACPTIAHLSCSTSFVLKTEEFGALWDLECLAKETVLRRRQSWDSRGSQ